MPVPLLSFPAAAPTRRFRRSTMLALAGLSALLLAPALAAQEKVLQLQPPTELASSSRPARTAADGPPAKPVSPVPAAYKARPGPWGELEYFTVFLEASISTLKSMDLQTYETLWQFVGYNEDQVAALFSAANLPAELEADLLDRKNWRRENKTVVVLPSERVLLGLSAEARATIYKVLGRWQENRFHHEPDLVSGQSVREWLARAQLPEEIVATIEKCAYPRNKNVVFADTPLVLRMVKTEDERLKIRKALSRTPTLVVKLRLNPASNIAQIAEYWGGYTRSKDVEPFLESISEIPGVNVVDIIHLLPTGVRRLLYTFPSASHGRTGYYPDCHWSSLNFGNFDPLERLSDPALATAYTLENYSRIPSGQPYKFGDVLFFMDGASGNAIHSCVFLADDIVYTKNGRSPTQPWVLMKLDDVVSFYAMYYKPQLACYRRKAE